MKKMVLALAVTAIAATSCKKNMDKQFDDRASHAGPFVATVTLPNIISANRTLTADTLYLLNGKVFVTNGAELKINAGSRIEGVKKSVAADASALVITRGASINAVGTSANPIVFTSHEATAHSGDWGGVVLLGAAPINKPDTTIEGIVPGSTAVDVKYGGGGRGLGDPDDYSGTIKYARIEYAGASIAADNELNGLTLGGVGASTTLSFIEVIYGADDAFEFFGGTVNADHLVAYAPDDDAFDTDFGFSGQLSFCVSLLNPSKTAYSANPNGTENDNDGTGSLDAPQSHPTYDHMTIIGMETLTQANAKGLLNGGIFRRRGSYAVTNSVFMGFPTGIDNSTGDNGSTVSSQSGNIVHAFSTLFNNFVWTGATTFTDASANASIKMVAPFNLTAPDFRPNTGSPLGTGTTYKGAFQAGVTPWTSGWTTWPTWN
ncbi:hypothetical protein [Deminuibacter soli]|uniref:T9SS C-terminal target domain-containing protein n=1 Tax=Deminuibacter soli TaxID=2291815 RepID=A0A3E1NNP9_9BACT|nr:hypothetical protein [Deminuibacter soli]RFM29552.1 hypothetical protein DXN05_00770 [Deminuibacter soli]